MAAAVLFDLATGLATELLKFAGRTAWSEIQLLQGATEELGFLKNSVETIQAVLLDAEKEQWRNRQVKLWLGRLKDVLYDVHDLLDDVATEDLRRKVMSGNKKSKAVCIFFSKSNQFIHENQVAKEIQKLRKRLDAIANEKDKFKLKELLTEEMAVGRGKKPENSRPDDQIIGREFDKKEIKKLLFDSSSSDTVAIVGKGGLGKTALAQLVYNDEEVKEHFDLKMWACVSDVFDVNLIIKEILKSVNQKNYKKKSRYELKRLLHMILHKKKYLLVLDDMWNEDRHKWSELGNWLKDGKQGSKILVTTRSSTVAMVTNKNSVIYFLEGLTTERSWDLFRKVAFEESQVDKRWEDMGRDIVRKCDGVPLAIITIGSFLYDKNEEQWEDYRVMELLEIPEIDVDDNGIMQVLKFSYDHLESNLKHCFAYCSLFPKNHIYMKEMMMPLWAAQGFIKSKNEGNDLEVVTDKYLSVLTNRSFLKAVRRGDRGEVLAFTLHDLMHDLARKVAEGECKIVKKRDNDERIRHVSFISKNFSKEKMPSVTKTPSFIKTSKLRTLLYWKGESSILNSDKVFSECTHCRALGLCEMDISLPSSSFEKLKQLRFLYISTNQSINILPDSITDLVNLQFLKLFGCTNLTKFSKDLRKLVNLRDLSIHRCNSLSELPPLSELPSLRTLSLICLDALKFIQPEQSNTLQPFFPSLENLVLFSCNSLIGWWERGQVMKAYRKNRSDNSQSSFPKLRSVEISECPNLIFVPPFPQVECLKIDSMKMLEEHASKPAVGSPFFHFSELKRLHLFDRDLKSSILETLLLSANNLESIRLYGRSQWLLCGGMEDLFLHRKPIIRRCEGLNLLYQEDHQGTEGQFLAKLCDLQITYIRDWVALPEWIQRVTTLQSLEIYECENLESLPEWIGNFSSLKRLILCVCPKLKDLPIGIFLKLLMETMDLKIINCPNLEGNYQMDLDFPVITPEGI